MTISVYLKQKYANSLYFVHIDMYMPVLCIVLQTTSIGLLSSWRRNCTFFSANC